MPRYVIIGGSAGAVGAVEAIREVDPGGEVTMVTEERIPAYSRPMIGSYLSGDASLEDVMYRGEEFWRVNGVETITGRVAMQVNSAQDYVELKGGERIHFEKLLISTGSRPFIPKMEGAEREGVFTFTNLADADGVRRRVGEVERVVVLGGGLIGFCVAEALVKLGVEVTIIELKDSVLSLLLDNTASTNVSEAARSTGVNILTGKTLQRIDGRGENGGVTAAVLDDGSPLPCEMVVIAVGLRPHTELVEDSDVKVHRGIVVDGNMRTSVPNIYSCGDVAEAYDFIYDRGYTLPQWPLACLGGRVAGYNMAGEKREYPGGTLMSALKYFDTPVVAAGDTTPQGGCEVLATRDVAENIYKKVVLKGDVIRGFILVGDIERAGMLFHFMREGMDVGGVKEKLLEEGFDLADLPEDLRGMMLMGDVI